ncbi:hypothetical protein TEA_021977 [Camellia sinensis var. sinensis]|uniref:Uncharacterized protein n=1 Tax=Camellia sinensis var. sinensis TaxID=542762 RepID=A0A4S4EL60_CAMSN|nr:hypothetical protein TEA_021977 [Camellia sinensis var. sinensis]
MYVARPLSYYLRSPEYLSLPPEGPNSGYLVIQDEESETTTCFGLCKNRYLINLPFPQNKDLTVQDSSGTVFYDATFVPVLNQPLSSNLYYAIKLHGSRKGCMLESESVPGLERIARFLLLLDFDCLHREAYACSREEDMRTCCFCNCIRDVDPRPLDPNDIYQQFQIIPYATACRSGGTFYATSILPDAFPPYFLRTKGWEIYTKTVEFTPCEGGDALPWEHTLVNNGRPPTILKSQGWRLPKGSPTYSLTYKWRLRGESKIRANCQTSVRTSETEPNIRDCSTDNKRMWKRQEVVQKCRRAKAGCSEISSEQGNLRMLMRQTLKFSSCSSVHHARSCMIVKGIQAGGAGHPIRGCRISWLRKFKDSRSWAGSQIPTKTPKNYELGEALGINTALRASLPAFDFPLSYKSSEAIVVGKWYCPFMFIKDGTLRDQMKISMFYEMTLEQRWEQIFTCENGYNQGNVVSVDVTVQRERVIVVGREAVWDENNVANGVIWFTSFGGVGEEVNIGLSSLIVDRMKWEQERGGWLGGEKRQVTVNKTEEYAGIGVGGWSRFGCYVLVERFVLKRMDGNVVLTYDFKHTHVLRSKWE